MEVGFKPKKPHRGEITMSITGLMQPMFLPWLHRNNGANLRVNPVPKGIFDCNDRPCVHAKNRRTVIVPLVGNGSVRISCAWFSDELISHRCSASRAQRART
jgi:hypothetical protein